jgi:Skp family chaperone for outer membrane proteins
MTSRKLVAATAGAAAALIFATTAFAQTAAPAAAVSHGPALAGVCYMSTQEALATSTVGKAVNTRMQQLIQQVTTELQPEQTIVQNEAKALQAAGQSADRARVTAFQTRAEALNTKAGQRQRELEATQQKQLARVLQEMDPIAKQVYQQRKCSILLDRDSVMLGNPSMDLTASVVAGLNAKIQTLTFNREVIAAQPAAK